MISMIKFTVALLVAIIVTSCKGQYSPITSPETQELSEDFDKQMPFYYKMTEHLTASDTSPGWDQKGQRILLTGIVYERDGKTPGSGVLLYYYHTDVKGNYATNTQEPLNMPKNKLGQTHGYMRGWVKTGADGRYKIYTVMPGSYPEGTEPAHIHLTLKEKYMEEPYYVDDFVFDDDPLLTRKRRIKMENRGGSGVIRFVKQDQLWVGERNLILGLHIPDYPVGPTDTIGYGKQVGEDLHSFTPWHAYGPDSGTRTCPICKYGWYHGVLYFVGNKPDWEEIRTWLLFLEKESLKRAKYLKAFFIYGNDKEYSHQSRLAALQQLGNELNLKNIALTFVPSFADEKSEIDLNGIDQNCGNTFIVYRRNNIIARYSNLRPLTENFELIQTSLDQTDNTYFRLPGISKE